MGQGVGLSVDNVGFRLHGSGFRVPGLPSRRCSFLAIVVVGVAFCSPRSPSPHCCGAVLTAGDDDPWAAAAQSTDALAGVHGGHGVAAAAAAPFLVRVFVSLAPAGVGCVPTSSPTARVAHRSNQRVSLSRGNAREVSGGVKCVSPVTLPYDDACPCHTLP